MSELPRLLSIESAERDFAGPGRTVRLLRDQGIHVKFDNGWTVSIQWSAYHYCSSRRFEHLDVMAPAPDSPDAEVAAWKGDDADLIALGDDTVAGWQPIDHIVAALDAAARDDQDGIVEALTREVDGVAP